MLPNRLHLGFIQNIYRNSRFQIPSARLADNHLIPSDLTYRQKNVVTVTALVPILHAEYSSTVGRFGLRRRLCSSSDVSMKNSSSRRRIFLWPENCQQKPQRSTVPLTNCEGVADSIANVLEESNDFVLGNFNFFCGEPQTPFYILERLIAIILSCLEVSS